MAIALKEANETDYWIDLLFQAKHIDEAAFKSIKEDLTEILKLLISIIKTAKQNIKK